MRRVALRGLFARKTRLLLTALAVALGVTLIAGTYVFTDTINSSFDRIFSVAYSKTDVAVTRHAGIGAGHGGDELGPTIPTATVGAIRALPQVAAAEGSVFDASGAILDSKGDPISRGAPNFIASLQTARFQTFTVAQGRLPAAPDEVAIDRATAKRHDFTVGKRVDIVAMRPKKRYRVVGTVQVAGVDSYGGASVAIMTLPEAQRILGKTGYDQIDVAAKPGVTPAALRAAVRSAVPRAYDVRTGAQQAAKQTSDIKDNLSFLTTALLAFAGISLFVGAFIIFNTFSITVAQRGREFGLLRTLGATRAQVLRSVLSEGLVVGVLGSLAGLGLGVLTAKGLKGLFGVIGFDLPSQGTVVQTRTVVVSLLVGVVVTLVASLAPALRATRVPPIAALREGVAMAPTRSSRRMFVFAVVLVVAGATLLVLGLTASDATTGLSLSGGGAAATFIGVALMSPRLVVPLAAIIGTPLRGVTGRLARENAVRQPGRTASTAAALMIGVALVSFASIFAASAKQTVAGYIDRGFNGDIVVQDKNGFAPFSTDAKRAVAAVPGVARVTAIRFGRARAHGKNEGVTGVDPGTFTHLYNLTEGGAVVDRLRPGDVAVEHGYAKKHHLRPGSTLVVQTSTVRALRLHVAGEFKDKATLLGHLVIANAAGPAQFGLTQDTYLFASFAHGVAVKAGKKAVARVLKTEFPQTEVLTAQGFKDDQAGQVDQLLSLIYALLALAVIVSLFGIVNTLVLSITERTRELGMLRAIGMSRRQVRSMIRKESIVISVIGGTLGLVVGIALSVVFTQAIHDIKLHVPAGGLVALLVLSAIAGALAAALPARRAARLDVLDALAYE